MGYSPWGLKRVGHDWATNTFTFWPTFFPLGSVKGRNRKEVGHAQPCRVRREHLHNWNQHHGSRGCGLSLASYPCVLPGVMSLWCPTLGRLHFLHLWAERRSHSACVLISTPSVDWWCHEARQKSKMIFSYRLKKQGWNKKRSKGGPDVWLKDSLFKSCNLFMPHSPSFWEPEAQGSQRQDPCQLLLRWMFTQRSHTAGRTSSG